MKLDRQFIDGQRRKIEDAIVPAMARTYGAGNKTFGSDFRPGLKTMEKVVSYHDYYACGISVLAAAATTGNDRAEYLFRTLISVTDHYRRHIFQHEVEGAGVWTVPLRRLLLHLALAYERVGDQLDEKDRQWFHDVVDEQVPLAIEHCRDFLPGEKNLHLTFVNNHTAIFMQGIYHCGRIFRRPEWVAMTREFAERYYASGHSDGYFEEHTNTQREGGPSLVYTRLTAGCLYDVLDGNNAPREKFIRAGSMYRSLVDHDFHMIPIADERTSHTGSGATYGLALHSLSAPGRSFIVNTLAPMDFGKMGPEGLAVLHHELGLMQTGDIAEPESRIEGNFRLTLPLGIVRRNGFTAGVSGLRALNREIAPESHYALDQQNMVYLSHRECGPILTGMKSKHDPAFSTFRIGEDAYTTRTGSLDMGEGWAEARLHYRSFNASIRWEIGEVARLTLKVDTDRPVRTALPIAGRTRIKTTAKYTRKKLKGFSPYSDGNISAAVPALVFQWSGALEIVLEAG